MLIGLGVTGGIGAYKSVEVARGLQKRGHDVVAIMTRSAHRFVGELTFEAITRRPVITDQFARGANANIEHIALATDIGLLLVAPATANIIGKFANGIADDFLTSLYLATRAPVLMAPGDEHQHARASGGPAEHADADGPRRELRRSGRGLPGLRLDREGSPGGTGGHRRGGGAPDPSCRARCSGAGSSCRPARPTRISIRCDTSAIDRAAAWVTPSPRRPLDEARTSCSSRVRPHLQPPTGVQIERVRSAAEMHRAMLAQTPQADAVIMAAAVADYTPRARGGSRENREAERSLDGCARAHAGHPGGARSPAIGRRPPGARRVRRGNRRPQAPRP